MPHATAALVLAIVIGAVNLGELAYFSDGYALSQWGPIVLWGVLPALAVCWLGHRLLRSGGPAKILNAGLGVALALGAFGAWDVTLGPGRDEPLNGLIVVTMPAFQNLVLLLSVLAAWLAERRIRAAASRA